MKLIYEKKDHIARFTLNRPEVMNALDPELFQQMHEAFTDFAQDPELWVGVVTGSGGKAFCAGADVKTWLPFVRECRERPWLLPATPLRGMDLEKPLVAAVNGLAMGGGLELALACDLRIASSQARFAFPEARLGILPRLGGTVRLPRLVGWPQAAEMMFTGRIVGAAEAVGMGLVNRAVEPEEVLPASMELAQQICGCAPLAVQAIKKSYLRSKGMSEAEALWCENALGLPLYDTEDYQEGRRAFKEKRPPAFRGK